LFSAIRSSSPGTGTCHEPPALHRVVRSGSRAVSRPAAEARFSDIGRQFANIFGAIFQIYAAYVAGSAVGTIARELHSPIMPAPAAFSIWGPIFILAAIYALYQGMPAERERPLFRATGWWTAASYFANGAWIYAFTSRQFALAQAILLAGLVFAAGALLRLAHALPAARATTIANRLIGPAIGLLAGWLTAATAIGVASTLVSFGRPRDRDLETVSAATLLVTAAVAVALVLASRRGPSGGWVAYGAAMLWGLAAIVVEQRSAAPLATGAATIGGALVILALLVAWRMASGVDRPRRSSGAARG
jgi:hypothetical protein